MHCPKCHSEYQDKDLTCPGCGLVFAKYFRFHAAPDASPEAQQNIKIYDAEEIRAAQDKLQPFLYEPDQPQSWHTLLWHGAVLLGLAIWTMKFIGHPIASNYAGQSFMHMVNTPFHEAGHILFRPFGAFLHSLGGSLGQVLMPALCFGTLLFKTRDPFGASVALWWIGQNFIDMAPYMNDARAGELPLLGGNFGHSSPYGFHDWEFILNESGLLQYDHSIAKASFAFGALIMLLALGWEILMLAKRFKTLKNP